MKIKTIESSRFINKSEQQAFCGGVCTKTELYNACSSNSPYLLCSPANTYVFRPVCAKGYLTCGNPGGGQYDYCSNGKDYTTCHGSYNCVEYER